MGVQTTESQEKLRCIIRSLDSVDLQRRFDLNRRIMNDIADPYGEYAAKIRLVATWDDYRRLKEERRDAYLEVRSDQDMVEDEQKLRDLLYIGRDPLSMGPEASETQRSHPCPTPWSARGDETILDSLGRVIGAASPVYLRNHIVRIANEWRALKDRQIALSEKPE